MVYYPGFEKADLLKKDNVYITNSSESVRVGNNGHYIDIGKDAVKQAEIRSGWSQKQIEKESAWKQYHDAVNQLMKLGEI